MHGMLGFTSDDRFPLTSRSLGVVITVLGFLALLQSTAFSQSYTPIESKVKAAYLLNFARYVEWPAATFSSPDSPIVIAVLGSDPFGKTLDDTVEGKTANKRGIEIRRIKKMEEAAGCHLIYISRAEHRRQKEYLAALAGKPVLTVGESDDFLKDGGGINIVRVDDNLKFEVNLLVTRRGGLRVSSRILTLAIRIIQAEEESDAAR